MSPFRLSMLAALALAVLAAFMYARITKGKRAEECTRAFAEVVDYVARNGEPRLMPPTMLDYFGLPESDQPFRQIEVPLGREPAAVYGRVLAARQRGEETDVLLGDNYAKVGMLYYCTRQGKLLRAVAVLPPPTDFPDGQPAFKGQVQFWADWWERQKP